MTPSQVRRSVPPLPWPPTSLQDPRVPQPGQEDSFGVHPIIVEAANGLLAKREGKHEAEIALIEKAVLRLYEPFFKHPR